jgi:exodeoxyribonuclease VII small subunit
MIVTGNKYKQFFRLILNIFLPLFIPGRTYGYNDTQTANRGTDLPKKKNSSNFEKDLQELESLVEKMEAGDLSLEDSLVHFERGIALTRACQKALSEAEQKIQILLDENGSQKLQPFSSDENPDIK